MMHTAPLEMTPAQVPGAHLVMEQAPGENFPVALRLLPTSRKHYLMAVYGFARTTDDIGDQAPVDQRLSLLDELEADLRRLYAGLGKSEAGQGAPAAGALPAPTCFTTAPASHAKQ